jgi:hypothetical protein
MANETSEARKNTVAAPTRLENTPKSAGALVSVVTFTLDAGDRGAQTAFALAQDVRGELRQAVDGSIDAVENLVRAFFRVGKRITARVDELSAELTSAGERTTAGIFRGLKDTTRAAGELASTAAAAAIAGERPAAQN